MGKKKPKTNLIVPRNYGAIIESGSNRCFYEPARYVLGHIAVSTPNQLRRNLIKWQQFKHEETSHHEKGDLSYEPLFPVKEVEALVSLPVDDAEAVIIEAILKKEGCKNLWEKGGAESVRNAVFQGDVLAGEIKSKGIGFATVSIGHPFVTLEGLIQHSDLRCDSGCGDYERRKGFFPDCSHTAAMQTLQFMQLRGIQNLLGNPISFINYEDSKVMKLQPTLPFDFVSDPFLSNLEIDVLLAHYIKGEGFYGINRKLTDISEHYSPALIRTADRGLVGFGVMRQDTVDFHNKNYKRSETGQISENSWARQVRSHIRSQGYRSPNLSNDNKWMRTYSLVFRGGEFETFAERYEKGDEVMEIAFFPDHAPLVISKKLYGPVHFLNTSEKYNRNPFSNLAVSNGRLVNRGRPEDVLDDHSRRRCRQLVFVPESVGLSQKMASSYRNEARKATNYQPSQDQRIERF